MTIYLRHGLFWFFIYLIWTYLKSGGGFYFDVALETLLNMAAFVTVFYIIRLVLAPKYYSRGKLKEFAIGILILVVAIYFYWNFVSMMQWQQIPMDSYLLELVQSFVPAMMLLAIESHGDQQRERERRLALEKEKMASELKLLKSQINPQFLLGTLNNLYENVISKSPKAPEMIMRLSEVLDYVLYKSQKKTVTLQEELSTIKSFLALEEIRFKNRLVVEWNATGELNSLISPLVLLDVVQHLFQSIEPLDQDISMKISVTDADHSVSFLLWYLPEHQSTSHLISAENSILRQLTLVYPDRHLFSLKKQDDGVRLALTIHAAL